MKAQLDRIFVAALLLDALSGLLGCGPGSAAPAPARRRNRRRSVPECVGVCGAVRCGAKMPSRSRMAGMPTALTGTDQVLFADIATGGNVSAAIGANQLLLVARCQALQFTGVWGLLGTAEAASSAPTATPRAPTRWPRCV